jgi:glycine cleavage system transcriptional repressor
VTQLVVSAVGRDRPGIAAAVTGVLVEHGANLADAQMGILSGHFAMTLIVDAPAALDPAELRADLDRVAAELGLDAIFVNEVAPAAAEAAVPSLIVTVYGADHPGIVHAVTRELADRGVNITDLNTHRIEEGGGEALYAMMLEVALPPGTDRGDLEAALVRVAREQRLELSVRELEDDAL